MPINGAFIILICVSVSLICLAESETITVSPDGSLQAAIDAASPGDTIFIQGVVYHETLNVNLSNWS